MSPNPSRIDLWEKWGNKPYHPISQFYKDRFGGKVFKVPVALAEDCPNRMGLKGMKTCIFCDVHGSFAYPENATLMLREQIESHMQKVLERTNSKKFLIYFQAYTTTFTQLKRLKEAFEVALSYPDVVGLVVGTRPDCLSDAVLDFWHETSLKTFLSVEMGAQSFDNKQLKWMERGHTAEQTVQAVHRVAQRCPQVNLGIHLMFGWPDESVEDVVRAASICNSLPIQNVKLHNLHVLTNTPLELIYKQGGFIPASFERYCELVSQFLGYLDERIAVHRLAALASRWDELVAPNWAIHRMRNYQSILDYMNRQNVMQSSLLLNH